MNGRGVMTAYKLAFLEILRNLLVLAYNLLRVRAIPTYRVYRLYDEQRPHKEQQSLKCDV